MANTSGAIFHVIGIRDSFLGLWVTRDGLRVTGGGWRVFGLRVVRVVGCSVYGMWSFEVCELWGVRVAG